MNTNKQYIFGIHAVTALIEKHPERIIRLLAAVERGDHKIATLLKLARKNNIEVGEASRAELDKLTGDANHQGIVAFCVKARAYDDTDLSAMLEELSEPAFLLILDGVQDPHNLGACFRS